MAELLGEAHLDVTVAEREPDEGLLAHVDLHRLSDALRRHLDMQANSPGGHVDLERVCQADLGSRGHPVRSVDLLVVHEDGDAVVVEPVFERDVKQRVS
jgi:hypothetical protein